MPPVSGTEGYAEQAETLLRQYESLSFGTVHATVRHLFPAHPSRVLDIGSGTGRDAAGFAELGHRVLAVEPTAEFRLCAAALYPSPKIEWLDDCLPELALVIARGESCTDYRRDRSRRDATTDGRVRAPLQQGRSA